MKSQKGAEELFYCLTGQYVPKYKCRCHPPGSALNDTSNPGRGLWVSYKIILFVMPSPCDLHRLFQSSWYNIPISRIMQNIFRISRVQVTMFCACDLWHKTIWKRHLLPRAWYWQGLIQSHKSLPQFHLNVKVKGR